MTPERPGRLVAAVLRDLPSCWWLAVRCAVEPWLAIGYLIWHNAPWRPARAHR